MDQKTQTAQEKWIELFDKWEPEYQLHLEYERKIGSYLRSGVNPPLDLVKSSEFHMRSADEIYAAMEKIIKELDA
jgi:hypothetical protein